MQRWRLESPAGATSLPVQPIVLLDAWTMGVPSMPRLGEGNARHCISSVRNLSKRCQFDSGSAVSTSFGSLFQIKRWKLSGPLRGFGSHQVVVIGFEGNGAHLRQVPIKKTYEVSDLLLIGDGLGVALKHSCGAGFDEPGAGLAFEAWRHGDDQGPCGRRRNLGRNRLEGADEVGVGRRGGLQVDDDQAWPSGRIVAEALGEQLEAALGIAMPFDPARAQFGECSQQQPRGFRVVVGKRNERLFVNRDNQAIRSVPAPRGQA